MLHRLFYSISLLIIIFNGQNIKAETGFEILKDLNGKKLSLHIIENGTISYKQPLTDLLKEFSGSTYFLKKEEENYSFFYKGKDKSSLNLIITSEGDIHILKSLNTNFNTKKKWTLKTAGKVINKEESIFYDLFIQAKEIHNYGILKSFTGQYFQDYFFNKGILHFGDHTDYLISDAYINYKHYFIQRDSYPIYQKGFIDDYGVILAERGLKISHLVHRLYGLAYIQDQLVLEQASIDNRGQYIIKEKIYGNVDKIQNYGFLHIGLLTTKNLTLHNWNNEGEVYLESNAEVFPQESNINKGKITSYSNVILYFPITPDEFGSVITKEDISIYISERVYKSSIESLNNKSVFVSRAKRVNPFFYLLKYSNNKKKSSLKFKEGRVEKFSSSPSQDKEILQKESTRNEDEISLEGKNDFEVDSYKVKIYEGFLRHLKKKNQEIFEKANCVLKRSE